MDKIVDLIMNDNGNANVSKYELKRRQIREEEARQRRKALDLSSGDENDYENFIPARQRKREKVCHKNSLKTYYK